MLGRFMNKRVLTDVALEVLGSFLAAVSIYNFALNGKFLMSGFSGIALIIYRLTGLPIGMTSLALNVPVALLCYKLLGRDFFFRSLRCMLIFSLMTDYVAPLLPLYAGDRLISGIYTGVVGGIGYALIYMRNSSTGGSDFITMAIRSKAPHLSIGKIAFFIEVVIILAGGVIFRDADGILYGLIINYLTTQIIDKLMYGVDAGKLTLIVTERGKEVVSAIDQCSGRGATLLSAKGGYNGQDKQVVLCACNNKQMHQIRQAARQVDPQGFIIILESNEVLGEGFKELQGK